MQTPTLREVNPFLSQMQQEKAQGKGIVMFHICSVGQIQFMLPVYKELRSRQTPLAFYLACDYPMSEKFDLMGIPASHRVTTEVAKQLDLTDVVLQAEIHGRGPEKAARVFVGHGQPNKHTNWSEENLRSFDHYFLYGELERSMFEVIMRSRPESTRHIKLYNVGYPKLDDQIQGKYDRTTVLRDLRLDPNLKTVIYAPAWDPGGSLRTLGTTVVEELLTLPGINVIAKLHPASLEPEGSPYHTFYTGGVNWAREFQALESNPRFRYVNDYLVNPLLVASDVMVTDFSGVALEFMVQGRPVIHMDCPEFYEKTLREWGNDPEVSRNDERFNAGRNTGLLIKNLSELSGAVQRSSRFPEEFSAKRRALIAKFLYNPGRASCVAADTVLMLLQQQQRDPVQPVSAATTATTPVKSPPALLQEAARLMETGRHASALSKLNAAAKQSSQLSELHVRRAQCLAALNRSREAVEAAVSELVVNSGSSAAVQILLKYQNDLVEILKTAPPSVVETVNRVLHEYVRRVTPQSERPRPVSVRVETAPPALLAIPPAPAPELQKDATKASSENAPDLFPEVMNSQAAQRQLFFQYQMLRQQKLPLPSFRDAGFRAYSQNDEDGLLLYVFALIGFTNKLLVDMASGTPIGANTTNLICNWGCTGLLMEGHASRVEKAKRFFSSHPDTAILPPKVECQWLTAENVNGLIQQHGLVNEIDLFSLDIDGVDYWLWKNLQAVQPRVVICEAGAFLGKERAITVPYSPRFNRFDCHANFYGASAPAFVKLAREKGYRLVAANRFGFNLIFVRNDLGRDVLPEISVADCFHFEPPELLRRRAAAWQSVAHLPWVEV